MFVLFQASNMQIQVVVSPVNSTISPQLDFLGSVRFGIDPCIQQLDLTTIRVHILYHGPIRSY